MSSIVRYLTDWHGIEPFRDLLGDSLATELDTLSSFSQAEQIARHLGFTITYSARAG